MIVVERRQTLRSKLAEFLVDDDEEHARQSPVEEKLADKQVETRAKCKLIKL